MTWSIHFWGKGTIKIAQHSVQDIDLEETIQEFVGSYIYICHFDNCLG